MRGTSDRLGHRAATSLLLSVIVIVAAACSSTPAANSGGPTTSGTVGAVTKDATIAAEVPSAFASKGTITVATDASYAPNEFFSPPGSTSNANIVGMDVDLGHAIGDVLGLKFDFVNANFDSILPGLSAGKYDISMSSFTDDEGSSTTNQREKVVNFVTYFKAGTSFYIAASGGPSITGLDSICGLSVGVERGTSQADDATAQSTKCTSAGKQAVSIQVFTTQNDANTALAAGRVVVVMSDSPVAAYAVQQSNGQFKLAGTPYGVAPYGIAVPKANAALDQPILDALKKLIADGVYAQILKKWGVEDGAIDNPAINGASA